MGISFFFPSRAIRSVTACELRRDKRKLELKLLTICRNFFKDAGTIPANYIKKMATSKKAVMNKSRLF